ncbi:pyrimidine/purine-5'-nucleotide nucleosidase [Planctomycetaceae bacterium]|nr:pyrimidine/purine-5'-nucleotide nucleosidase [Planctomycetaceae bacterium]
MAGAPLITVIGSGLEDDELNALAFEVGALIAEAGCTLVNGGLGGVMAASARGAKSKGGLTIGILPGLDPEAANKHIDVPIPTGLGEMRNLLVARSGRAVIAIGGGYGTLSEIALALKASKKVIGLKTWDLSTDVIKASGPAEAVRAALQGIKAGR